MQFKELVFFEMLYPKMVGIMEVMQFMRIATPAERRLFEQFLKNNDAQSAWELLTKVLKIKAQLPK